MKHIIHPATGTVHRVEIEQIGFAEVNSAINLGNVLPSAGGEVIYSPDLIALCKNRAGKRRTDESGYSSDEIKGHGFNIPNAS